MTKIKTNDWRNLPIEKWNTTTFHAYLSDKNKEYFGVEEYVPFGQGAIGKRWAAEKGMVKQAIEKYGNEVIKKYIDLCIESHSYNAKYPCLPFGFMWAYKRTELNRAVAKVKEEQQRQEAKNEAEQEIDVDLDAWL